MVDFKSLVPWRNTKPQAPATRDDFFDPFVTFRREMDRMFDNFFGGDGMRSSPGGWQSLSPAVDVAESDKDVTITAELPGVTEKDVEVTVSGDVLTIRGEKRFEEERTDNGAHYTERRFGAFSRSVPLPFKVQDESVEARFKDGVLTIRLPKPANLQSTVRRIEVKAA